MKFSIFLRLLFFIPATFIAVNTTAQSFDKAAFYHALSSESIDVINTQISLVKASSIAEKEAYEGALLMKKAGVTNGNASQKLSLFKSGRSKLEASISKNNDNMEYRFLRLIIQENAPKIVKYRNEIEQDSQLVKTNFKTFPQYLQHVITDYSKKSKALKIG